jgi:RNA polymerase sigma-70 factor, ECF subfamily
MRTAKRFDADLRQFAGQVRSLFSVRLGASTMSERETTRSTAADPPPTHWDAALRGDRDAFRAAVAPYLGELLEPARREIDYHVALGDFDADDLTLEELVGDVLARAWKDRQRRPRGTGIRTWLLALLLRVAETAARREARLKRLATVSLERPVPPEPIYDDDESFWEWYQPDHLTRWEDVVDDAAAADEAFTRTLDPQTREIFLLSEVHGIALPEIARALDLPDAEAARLLAEARRRIHTPVSRETRS